MPFLILCGKSCSGKDSMLKILKQRGFEPVISVTSRPIREGETNGIEYEFVSKELFESFIKADKLIEYRSYHTTVNGVDDTWYYGTLKGRPTKLKDYVVILDLEGAKDFEKWYGPDQCYCVYIEAPDEIRTIRAMQRGSFDETEWNRRLEADAEDFSEEKLNEIVDFRIANTGDIMKTVETIDEMFDWSIHNNEKQN